ncbi:MAG TPA: guanylate kinase [Syntrophales bacterium]|nr:guanylate kinase [Syntrophales bacterium]
MPKKNEPIYIAVSAPSGAGKTSICKEVLKMFPCLRYSVSYTTRPPRPGEVNGRDYVFVDEKTFRRMIKKEAFIEWAENYGHLYGTPRKEVENYLRRGYDIIFDVDSRGAKALKERYPGGVFVFVLPPSLEVLKRRLRGRGSESPEALKRRLEKATAEIKEVFWYDYVIFNRKIEESVDRLRAVYLAEKSRRERLVKEITPFIVQND